jgi:hypothetical protein
MTLYNMLSDHNDVMDRVVKEKCIEGVAVNQVLQTNNR